MPNEYPWYEAAKGGELEQGDILWKCPVIVPVPDLPFPLPREVVPIDITTYDVIIMTQSCDLVQEKTENVMLCPHRDLTEAGEIDSALRKSSAHQEIRKGRRPRYVMLEKAEVPGLSMGVRIVDFGNAFSLPKEYIRQFAINHGPRLRLCPPYREHLSQAFARYFMRVGLPQDIKLP